MSFQSADQPLYYLRHYAFVFYLEENTGTFNVDATFIMIKDKYFNGFDSFHSVNYPTYFIRHQNFRLKISEEINEDGFKDYASFKTVTSTGNV